MSDTNKLFEFDLDRKLNSRLKFQPNFLAWLPNTEDHSLSAIFVIYSIFRYRNQISFFSNKVYFIIFFFSILVTMDIFDLVDIQRVKHPNVNKYSYESKTLKVRSRIDFFLISQKFNQICPESWHPSFDCT